MRKIVVLTDYKGNISGLRGVINELQSLPKCSWKIISLNHMVVKILHEEGIPHRFIDEYFFEDDHYNDYSQAIEISHQWFLDTEGRDVTLYRGISLGVILQRLIIQFFSSFLSTLRTGRRVLEEECPDELWLLFSDNGSKWNIINNPRIFLETVSLLAQAHRVFCRKTVFTSSVETGTPYRGVTSAIQRAKYFLYLFIRKLLFFTKYHLVNRKEKDFSNILVPSPSALNYVGRTIIEKLLSDKRRNVFIWRGETARQRVNLIDIPPPFFSEVKQNNWEVISRIERQFSGFLATTGIGELKAAAGLLKHVYKRHIKPLVHDIIGDIESLESYLSRMNVHLVFSHADTTIRERTAISVANKYKVPSLVLQHGSAGQYWGFFPLIATKFAAWGEITKRWFERNGVTGDRICVTGAANFDSYVRQVMDGRGEGNAQWHGMHNYLLYITVLARSFSTGFKHTQQDNERLLDAIFDALETMPERMLVIKLRQRDPQAEYYKSEIERRGLRNVYLVGSTDNGKLLSACGVLFTTRSTMALEALFFEKPVILLKSVNKKKLMKNLCEQNILCDEDIFPLAKYGGALEVETPEELREGILNIYAEESLRRSLVQRGKAFLAKYCYETDGKASFRVLQCIDQLVEQGMS